MCPSIATYLSICCSFNDLTNILKSNSVAYNVKMAKIIISSQCNMFSPWYNWTVANLLLNKNHWLTELWEYTLSSICNFQVVSDHDYLSINKSNVNNTSNHLLYTFKIFQLYRVGQLYWCRNPEYPQKTTDLPQGNDTLYHTLLYRVPLAGFELTTLVVIGTDCTGSFKSNYHTITTTTALK